MTSLKLRGGHRHGLRNGCGTWGSFPKRLAAIFAAATAPEAMAGVFLADRGAALEHQPSGTPKRTGE
jgi:hypothetical protein